MNEEMKRKALEALLAQQQEPQFDKQKAHDLMMEGVSPGSPQMEEAMNMAGGAMGGISKVPNILKSTGPSRFSKVFKQGTEGGYQQRLAPELENIRPKSLASDNPLMQGLEKKYNQMTDLMDQKKLRQLIDKFGR